jgi:two-component system cell cycle response regulator
MARILIIEDNPTNLELMSYLLTAFGHTTLTAYDGATGLETARGEAPELIICDVQMPGLDGYMVAQRLKSDPGTCAIPLVAVTAVAMVGDRDRALAAGFDGYITKPIVPEAFVGQVEAFLARDRHAAARLPIAAPDRAA